MPPRDRPPRPYPEGTYMHVRDPALLRERLYTPRILTLEENAYLLGLYIEGRETSPPGVSASFLSQLIGPRDVPTPQPRKRSCRPETGEALARMLRAKVGELFDVRQDPGRSGPDTEPFRVP